MRGPPASDTGTKALLESEGRLTRLPHQGRVAAAVLLALLPILLLAACGGSSHGGRAVRSPYLVGSCVSATCASVTAILHGDFPGSPSAHAYALYVDGQQRRVQQSPPFDFGALHCGIAYRHRPGLGTYYRRWWPGRGYATANADSIKVLR